MQQEALESFKKASDQEWSSGRHSQRISDHCDPAQFQAGLERKPCLSLRGLRSTPCESPEDSKDIMRKGPGANEILKKLNCSGGIACGPAGRADGQMGHLNAECEYPMNSGRCAQTL